MGNSIPNAYKVVFNSPSGKESKVFTANSFQEVSEMVKGWLTEYEYREYLNVEAIIYIGDFIR